MTSAKITTAETAIPNWGIIVLCSAATGVAASRFNFGLSPGGTTISNYGPRYSPHCGWYDRWGDWHRDPTCFYGC